eukprot:TRINITY_DN1230_c0_g1_i5.p2 TRINITY_DN1230_c0_g1~~TRINITY_DN1230_c0_g1_i5.p2  ORF type:complete len:593 (+),score=179.91 TRINITY_DN1230_c0_g1_i5:213-1781(+)
MMGGNQSILNDMFQFKGKDGRMYLELTSEATHFDSIHTLKARRMGIHDGKWTTDSVLEYTLQGFYVPELGAGYLIFNPLVHPNILFDFSVDLPVVNKSGSLQSNHFGRDIVNSILESESRALRVLEKGAINDTLPQISQNMIKDHRRKKEQKCFMVLTLKFKPVPMGFNDQWSYFYNQERHKAFIEERKLSGNDEQEERPQLEFDGIIYSPECNFGFKVESSSVAISKIQRKAINYALITSIATVIQIILVIKQIDYTSTQSMIIRVSTTTIVMQTIMDGYLWILHINSSFFMDVTFNAFAAVAFLEFSLSALFESRYFFIVWKARRPSEQPEAARNSAYLRFYVLVLATPMIMYLGKMLLPIFLLLLFSFFVPQIWTNVQLGSNKALQTKYIIGMALTRFLLPAYLLGCPNNFVRTETKPWLVIITGIWLAIQVTVLLLQDRYGSRFFIPGTMLPEKYNYRRPLTVVSEEGRECVICMNTVDVEEDYMLTPCDHIFHAECLGRWMDQKLECPTCRRRLPLL